MPHMCRLPSTPRVLPALLFSALAVLIFQSPILTNSSSAFHHYLQQASPSPPTQLASQKKLLASSFTVPFTTLIL